MNTGYGEVIEVHAFSKGTDKLQIFLVGESWEMPLSNRAAFDLALALLSATREDGADWVMSNSDEPDDISGDDLNRLMSALEQSNDKRIQHEQ